MPRPKIKNKKKKVCVYLTPETLEIFKKFCQEQNIENYSDYIEKLINKNIKEL
jgi:hypothetical protein